MFPGPSALQRLVGPLGWTRALLRPSSLSTSCPSCSAMRVFDRKAKLLQRERAAADTEVERYDFLKEEVSGLGDWGWEKASVLASLWS